jgi:hypothetical protein
LLFGIMNLHSQIFKMDSTKLVTKKKLTLEEVNIVSSYYNQDGNHSGVTGGIGTEKLTDIANTLDIKFAYDNGQGIKRSLGLEFGVDYYTSASSDNIDSRVSSASSADVRVYPSLSYSHINMNTGNTIGGNLSFSSEYDYISIGGGFNYSKASKDGTRELGFKANAFFDTYEKYLPEELRTGGGRKGRAGSEPRRSFDSGLSYSQVLSEKFQFSLLLDIAYQQGLLSTPFHRVYQQDNSLKLETLPGKRLKTPVGIRANYHISDNIIIRSFYRYYQDDWGLKSHTAQLEIPIKINKKLSISPFIRANDQTGMDYFYPYQGTPVGSTYFSSDFDLSTFNSFFYGTGIRLTPFKDLKYLALQSIEFRLGKYDRSDGMNGLLGAVHVQFRGF